MTSGVTTPGQVAVTSPGAIAFGLVLWIWTNLVMPRLSAGWTGPNRFFQWALPALFVLGGTVGEIVAGVGALTGVTWRS